jgi:hypothetical protein
MLHEKIIPAISTQYERGKAQLFADFFPPENQGAL